MKTKQEIREKKQRIAEKLSIRQVCKTPPKEKKWPTWEFELFKAIAMQRRIQNWPDCFVDYVWAKHIDKDWNETNKKIHTRNLSVSNFSHTLPKSTHPELRLDPNNIEIVSVAWHHYEHTKQILKVDYSN